MSKENLKKSVKEKNRGPSKDKDGQKPNYNLLSKHLKKVYPVGLYKASTSPLSLSSLSLSLSQNSSDSLTDSSSTLDQKIAAAIRLIIPREKRDVSTVARYMQKLSPNPNGEGLNRCNSEVTESRSHQQGLAEKRVSICWTRYRVLVHASCRDDH